MIKIDEEMQSDGSYEVNVEVMGEPHLIKAELLGLMITILENNGADMVEEAYCEYQKVYYQTKRD